MLEEIDKKEKS